jgi:hypothetical protein
LQLHIIEIELIIKHSPSFLQISAFNGHGVNAAILVVVIAGTVLVVVVIPFETSHKTPLKKLLNQNYFLVKIIKI